jgi:hypothetical protein
MTSYETPTNQVEARTLVFDPAHYREVMWLTGSWPLPPGTLIDLDDRVLNVRAEAVVRNMRLIGRGTGELTIRLDCEVDNRWWDAHPLSTNG